MSLQTTLFTISIKEVSDFCFIDIIYLLAIKRCIRYIDFAGLSKSSDPTDGEFIIHVEDDYDYSFPNKEVDRRNELFENMKAAYFMKRNKNLPIYKVSVPLDTYLTTKKDIKN